MSKQVLKKSPAKKSKTSTAKKSVAKKSSPKKKVVKKTMSKKSPLKKSVVKKSLPKKKVVLKKSPPKKKVVKKVAPKKSAIKKASINPIKKAKTSLPIVKKPTSSAPIKKEKVVAKKGGKEKNIVITIGSPRLAGLRPAPGVQIIKEKVVARPKKHIEAQKLTKKELGEIKNRLLEMRAANLSNIRKKLEDAHERLTQPTPDVIDQASDACDEDISLEIAATKDEQLQLINTALEKISAGEYGVCVMCGEIIAPTRLRLLPFVVRCKECRDIYEKTRSRNDINWALVSSSITGDETEVEEVEEE